MTPLCSKAYISAQVATSDRVDLVIALYEVALASVAQAMKAVETGDTRKRGEAIRKASDIILVLCESLDHTQAAALPGQLFSLYNFHLAQLLEANRANDLEPLQAVKSSLSILLSGWQEAARSPEAAEMRSAARRPDGRRRAADLQQNRRPLVMVA
jgi:flagellar secretion chaperone FliS